MKDLVSLNNDQMKSLNFIYTGYLLGYLDIKTIQSWADNQLLSNIINYKEDLLLDLSCANEKEILSILKINSTQDSDFTLKYYFSLYRVLGEKKKLSYDKIIVQISSAYRICNNSFQDKSFIEEDEKYNLFFTRLSDFQELIKDGYTGNMDMPNELISFLSNYQKSLDVFKSLHFKVLGIDIRTL